MNKKELDILNMEIRVLVEVEKDLQRKAEFEEQYDNLPERGRTFKMLHDVIGARDLVEKMILNTVIERDEDIDPTMTEEELEEENG